MTYSKFRNSLTNIDYVESLYVELRGNQGHEHIAGFFDVYDYAQRPDSIPKLIETSSDEARYRSGVFSYFSCVADVYYVFCDANNSQFAITSDTSKTNSFSFLDETSYIDFVHRLPGTSLSGRKSKPPRFPELMSSYSVWHYKLDWACKCRDIDFIEMRNNKPIAILEVTGKLNNESHLRNSLSQIRNRLTLQKRMMDIICSRVNIFGYFVIHTKDLSVFYVYSSNWELVGKFNQKEYVEWLNGI